MRLSLFNARGHSRNVGPRLSDSGSKPSYIGQGLTDRCLRLGRVRTGLGHLLVHVGRLNLGKHLALLNSGPDIDEQLGDIAAGSRLDRGFANRLETAGQNKILIRGEMGHRNLHDRRFGTYLLRFRLKLRIRSELWCQPREKEKDQQAGTGE